MAHAVEEDVSQRECPLVHRNWMKEQAEVRNVKLKCNRKGPFSTQGTSLVTANCKLKNTNHKIFRSAKTLEIRLKWSWKWWSGLLTVQFSHSLEVLDQIFKSHVFLIASESVLKHLCHQPSKQLKNLLQNAHLGISAKSYSKLLASLETIVPILLQKTKQHQQQKSNRKTKNAKSW